MNHAHICRLNSFVFFWSLWLFLLFILAVKQQLLLCAWILKFSQSYFVVSTYWLTSRPVTWFESFFLCNCLSCIKNKLPVNDSVCIWPGFYKLRFTFNTSKAVLPGPIWKVHRTMKATEIRWREMSAHHVVLPQLYHYKSDVLTKFKVINTFRGHMHKHTHTQRDWSFWMFINRCYPTLCCCSASAGDQDLRGPPHIRGPEPGCARVRQRAGSILYRHWQSCGSRWDGTKEISIRLCCVYRNLIDYSRQAKMPNFSKQICLFCFLTEISEVLAIGCHLRE